MRPVSHRPSIRELRWRDLIGKEKLADWNELLKAQPTTLRPFGWGMGGPHSVGSEQERLLLSMEEAETHMKPVLNKLGVKEKPGSRKAQIIWDLKWSQPTMFARWILLPKISDVVHDVLEAYRNGGKPRFLAVDIKDAFHNIPAGRDRAYTAAVIPWKGKQKVLPQQSQPTCSQTNLLDSPCLELIKLSWFGLKRPGITNLGLRLEEGLRV